MSRVHVRPRVGEELDQLVDVLSGGTVVGDARTEYDLVAKLNRKDARLAGTVHGFGDAFWIVAGKAHDRERSVVDELPAIRGQPIA